MLTPRDLPDRLPGAVKTYGIRDASLVEHHLGLLFSGLVSFVLGSAPAISISISSLDTSLFRYRYRFVFTTIVAPWLQCDLFIFTSMFAIHRRVGLSPAKAVFTFLFLSLFCSLDS
jgi:hypothetical protein